MALILKIKAVILTGKNKLSVSDIEPINKLQKGQILVKIFYSSVCGSQLMEFQGKRGKDVWIPHLMGHEGSGKIVEIGPGVKKFKKEDEVIIGWIKNAGHESEAPKYKYLDNRKQIINAGKATTFSNYSIISENRLTLKPKKLSHKEAVLFGCALPTGMGMAIKHIGPKNKKKSILVVGAGGVGLASALALYCYNFLDVTVVDKSKKKLKFVKSNFKFNTIDLKNINSQRKFINQKFDYCIESSGSIKGIEFGFNKIKNDGKLIFASHPPDKQLLKIDPHELIKGKRIVGSWGGGIIPEKEIKVMLKLISSKKFNLLKLLSKVYKLNQIKDALISLSGNNSFRPLIEMDH